jgi:TP901 family phage tail tape measure protein
MKLEAISSEGKKFDKQLRPLGVTCKKIGDTFKKDADEGILLFLKTVQKSKDPIGFLRDLMGEGWADDIAILADGLEGYEEALSLVSDETKYAGSMQREYEARSATTANKLQLLRNQVTALASNLGDVLLPGLNAVIEPLNSMTGVVGSLAAQYPGLTKIVGATAAGFVGMKIAALGTQIGWSYIKDGGSIAMDIFQRLRPSVIQNALAMARLAGNGSTLGGLFANQCQQLKGLKYLR